MRRDMTAPFAKGFSTAYKRARSQDSPTPLASPPVLKATKITEEEEEKEEKEEEEKEEGKEGKEEREGQEGPRQEKEEAAQIETDLPAFLRQSQSGKCLVFVGRA